MVVEHEGKQYTPLVFTMTRGRSDPIHYVFNYVRDEHAIYLVNAKQDRLIAIKTPLVDSFAAVFWSVARDAKHVFRGARRARSIKHPTEFRLFEQEAEMYFDGELYYDRDLAIIPVDAPTFALVEKSSEHRLRSWSSYNEYLASQKLPPVPFECSSIYSNYLMDRNGLYQRNGTTQSIWAIEPQKVAAMLRAPLSEDGEDVMTFIEKNPHVRSYEWLAAALASR
jgi:hypothetical protein